MLWDATGSRSALVNSIHPSSERLGDLRVLLPQPLPILYDSVDYTCHLPLPLPTENSNFPFPQHQHQATRNRRVKSTYEARERLCGNRSLTRPSEQRDSAIDDAGWQSCCLSKALQTEILHCDNMMPARRPQRMAGIEYGRAEGEEDQTSQGAFTTGPPGRPGSLTIVLYSIRDDILTRFR